MTKWRSQPLVGCTSEKTPKSQRHRGDLGSGVNRQDHIRDPIDQRHEREPVKIRVVPSGLRSETSQRLASSLTPSGTPSAPYMLCANSCPFENCKMAMMMKAAARVGMITLPTQFARCSIP